MRIAVIGAGFVGEATGRGLAKHKNDVVFVDVDTEKINKLKQEGFEAHLASEYTTMDTDVTMISVPTPTKGREVQFQYLEAAAKAIGERLKNYKGYHVVVVRSTVPPSTTRKVVLPIIEKASGKKAGADFGLAMQPEYLREVTAAEDFARPWFVFIGAIDKKSGDVLEKIYKPFDAPIERGTLEEAEIQKYVHNVYNAVKIAFFNELRIAMNDMGIDADKVYTATAESCEGIWNPMYGLKDYGPFDGSCLPKDTRGLLDWGDKNGYDFGILRAVVTENLRHERILGKNKTVRVNYLEHIKV
jgi:UDPglucose 6-dehydrogenase